MNKIKGQIDIDNTTLVCLLVIILVGIASFGLGRLSVSNYEKENNIKLEDKILGLVKGEIGENHPKENTIEDVKNSHKEKMYVASKNGKLYYTVNCSGAKRISEKNKVWFASSEEAEKSGYSLASSCK